MYGNGYTYPIPARSYAIDEHVNWDDLRYVLAVADEGSVSAAARALGVTHATVLRHVATFEAENGGPVFDKNPSGYTVMPSRMRVIEAARDVAHGMATVARLAQGGQAPGRGRIRISSTDSLCQVVLPGLATHLAKSGVEVELLSSNQHADLGRLQADLSIRPTLRLPDEMAGDIVAAMRFSVYGVADAPADWLGLGGPLNRSLPAKWMDDNTDPARIVARADSFLVLARMAAQGVGRAILPDFVGDATAGLVRLGAGPDEPVPLWVASHVDLYDTQRIRAARGGVLRYLREWAKRLDP